MVKLSQLTSRLSKPSTSTQKKSTSNSPVSPFQRAASKLVERSPIKPTQKQVNIAEKTMSAVSPMLGIANQVSKSVMGGQPSREEVRQQRLDRVKQPTQEKSTAPSINQAPPSIRPETPAPKLVGTTEQQVQSGYREYTPEEDRNMVSSIRESQMAGQELTSQQMKYLADKETAAMFAPQEQVNDVKDLMTQLEEQRASEIAKIEEEIKQTRLSQDERTAQRLEQYKQDLEAQYAPVIAQARQQADERTSTQERLLGATGALTGSVGVQTMNKIEEEKTRMLSAIEAEKRQALEIRRAQLEGADAETINSMRDRLQTTKEQATQLKQENIAQLGQLRMEAEAQGNEQLMNFLSAQMLDTGMAGQEVDDNVSKGLQYLADASGQPILDAEGNTIPYGAGVTAGSEILSTQQDPLTGQFFAIKQDPSGNVYADPIRVGQQSQGEFRGSPNQNSLVATYTQTFNGSKYNANGIDLAGEKGSPITSSVAGEVVFAGPKGGWGNIVQVKAPDGKVHQFAHLDGVAVQVGQRVNQLDYLGPMGNTGNVLKGDGSVPSPEELAAGRGTHLDYTVYDAGGNMLGLDVAKQYAGLGRTPFAGQAQGGQPFAITSDFQIDQLKDQAENTEQADRGDIEKSEDYKKLRELNKVRSAIDSYKQVFDSLGGKRNFFGADAQQLSTAYQGAIMQLKNAFELGALAGPDLALLQSNLPDPTSITDLKTLVRGGSSGISASIDESLRNLDRQRSDAASILQDKGISQFPDLAKATQGINVGTTGNQTLNTGLTQLGFDAFGSNYKTTRGLSNDEAFALKELINTQEGLEQAINAGIITPR